MLINEILIFLAYLRLLCHLATLARPHPPSDISFFYFNLFLGYKQLKRENIFRKMAIYHMTLVTHPMCYLVTLSCSLISIRDTLWASYTSSSRYFQRGAATTMRGLSMRWTMPLATGMFAFTMLAMTCSRLWCRLPWTVFDFTWTENNVFTFNLVGRGFTSFTSIK